MKILLINNHTQHLKSLQKSLAGHQVEIQKYKPGLDFHWQGKDLIVLSGGGGEGLEIHDNYKAGRLWYEDEIRFVRDCQTPIIGICMGFEVTCALYGSQIKHLPKLVQGFENIKTSPQGKLRLSRRGLTQFESHNFSVPDVDTREFEILARSKTGVEMITHRRRHLLATQFHPEKSGGTLSLPKLIQQVA